MILLAVSVGIVAAIAARLVAIAAKRNAAPSEVKSVAPVVTDARPLPPRDPFAGLACHLGDVVLLTDGEEAWLAGALAFVEQERTIAALFIAPDAGGDRAIFASDAASLLWLRPVDTKNLLAGGESPMALEIEGTRFERRRRLPLRVERHGTGAPDFGGSAILTEYTSASNDHLVVVTGGTRAHAWRGGALEAGMFEVIPSGKSTLEG